jgi:hypothetical protein
MIHSTDHNELIPTAQSVADTEEGAGIICALLRDGRLFGPFPSRKAARFWCISQDLDWFSTYDLLPPPDQTP